MLTLHHGCYDYKVMETFRRSRIRPACRQHVHDMSERHDRTTKPTEIQLSIVAWHGSHLRTSYTWGI